MEQTIKLKTTLATLLLIALSISAFAQDKPASTSSDAEELAKQLANPVASLISVPFQNNTDVGIGSLNGSRNVMNFQPVVPVKITSKINLITRLILPIVTQHNITGLGNKESGLSDALFSAIFSPAIAKNGLTWGIGPAILIPTATNDYLGLKKWGIGPQALVLKQTNGWTLGVLANQLWSFAGDNARQDVSQMFLQPFLGYNWKSGAGLTLVTENTFNWIADNTTSNLSLMVSGVTKMGSQTISMAIGPRIPLAAPAGAMPDFGVRAAVILVFPK